jgi:nucleoside-diphosphate-sugar epimerase
MKILITGGLGLIGHNVTAKLEAKDHQVVITDTQTNYGIIPQDELDYLMAERRKKIATDRIYRIDITDRDGIDWLIREHQPDAIIHMASFPRQKVVNANPSYGAQVMMQGLINVLESAKAHRVERVVYISSSMVYGDFDDQVTEDSECNPIGQYGIMKLAGEHLVKDYHRRGAFDYIIVRPSAVYGPLDVEDRVVAKFMLAAMRGETLRVNGAEETLDFTYVDDVADGIVRATTRIMSANRIYNITKSHSVTLLNAAEMIVKIVGKGTVEVRDKDTDFPSRGALDIDRARVILGYDPKVDVEEGFQRYYEWLANSTFWAEQIKSELCLD